MENTSKKIRLIVSGGGTGGHVFPAIAIANAVKAIVPEAEILFVGAQGRMEMEKVPAAGYKIMGLNVVGLDRKNPLKNLAFPFKFFSSLLKTRRIIKDFKPDVVVGVGGYASGPTLLMASFMRIACLIQEQNSYPGLTNRKLAQRKGIKKVCVDYAGMEKYFPKEKIVWTGNPIRRDIVKIDGKREEAEAFFGLKGEGKVILVVGGSLGAGTINKSMAACLDELSAAGCRIIWQCGKSYYTKALPVAQGRNNVVLVDFIARMDLAYALADIIVSRAGAIAISELCVVGKPCILVPSPNVAEDHQTKNALALSSRNAAILMQDDKAEEELGKTIIKLMQDENRRRLMSENIKRLARIDAAESIAKEILDLKK